MVAAAILSVVAVAPAASAVPVGADFAFSPPLMAATVPEAEFTEGALLISAPSVEEAENGLGRPVPTSDAILSFRADALFVERVTYDVKAIEGPGGYTVILPSEPAKRIASTHSGVSVEARGLSPGGRLLVRADPDASTRISYSPLGFGLAFDVAHDVVVVMDPIRDGHKTRQDVGTVGVFDYAYELDAAIVGLEAEGTARIFGAPAFYVYGTTFVVTTAQGSTTYETGRFDVRPAPGVVETHYEYLIVRAAGFDGEAHTRGGIASMFAPAVSARTDGEIQFRDAEGSLVVDDERLAVADETLRIDGRFDLALALRGPDRLAAKVAGDGVVSGADGLSPLAATPGAATRSRAPGFAGLLGTFALVGVLAAVVAGPAVKARRAGSPVQGPA
ncbi:MAG: hypothetical protein ACT4PT_13185, partial [Methanobacteriota archaeon]